MNIEYLYYFVEAADRLSISKAARAYNISQQGLSRAIRQIENEYGVALFVRDSAGIHLTPAGEVFLEEARAVIAAHNRLRNRIDRFKPRKRAPSDIIEILVTLNVAFNVLPALQEKLQRAFPDSIFSIKEQSYDQIVSGMCRRPQASTVAIVSIPDIPENEFFTPALEFTLIMDMELMARVGKRSFLAQRESISLDDLMRTPLIIHDDPALEAMLSRLLPAGESVWNDTLMRTNNDDLLKGTLREHDCIGFSNTFCKMYRDDADFRILPLEKSFKTPVYLVTNRSTDSSETQRAIKRKLVEIVSTSFPRIIPQANPSTGKGDLRRGARRASVSLGSADAR